MAAHHEVLTELPRHGSHGSLPSQTPATTKRPPARPSRAVQVVAVGCDALADAEPQALGVTYWFDTAPDGDPYPVTIRFTGRRIGVRKPGPNDTFTATETIPRVMPGSGRVAITTRQHDIAPGEWHVTATPVTKPGARAATRSASTRRPTAPYASSSGTTGFAPIIRVRAPGARLFAWPAFVGVGVAVAVTVQALLAAHTGLPFGAPLLVSLIASLIGLVGAKVYYVAEKEPRNLRRPRELLTAGMCIQGFVLAAIATAIFGMLIAGVPVGRFLDVAVPGLLFGMTVGRFGCFFGGCCVGRATASRWGLWCTDRHVGMRRIPTQLLESAVAFIIGGVALLAVLTTNLQPAGTVFVGAIAAYILGRQLLFPLRDLPRNTSYGRTITMIVAALVVLADVLMAVWA